MANQITFLKGRGITTSVANANVNANANAARSIEFPLRFWCERATLHSARHAGLNILRMHYSHRTDGATFDHRATRAHHRVARVIVRQAKRSVAAFNELR